jgi:LytS/YehU family sensor histidine kinase
MANFNPAFTPKERHEVLARGASAHPLETIPYFRRWERGPWRDLAYTLVWNTGFCAIFLAVNTVSTWRVPGLTTVTIAFVVSNCVGFTIHALFMLGGCTIEGAVRRRGRTASTIYYMVLSTAGVIAGFMLSRLLLGRDVVPNMGNHQWMVGVAATSVVISVVLSTVFFWRERSALAEAELEREQRRVADAEREAMAANLRALQAQIEPHFLFNTLANVTSLIESDPGRAKHMAETFIRFLRASLAATRRSRTTLGEEFALVREYLEVLKVRMGDRLEVRVDLPGELAGTEIPPMLLQPLVENAIQHGLEPEVRGGTVELRARRGAGVVVVEVADTGAGFGEVTSGGVGLANVRERLRLAHDGRGRLSIRENAPRGTIVTVELPENRA